MFTRIRAVELRFHEHMKAQWLEVEMAKTGVVPLVRGRNCRLSFPPPPSPASKPRFLRGNAIGAQNGTPRVQALTPPGCTAAEEGAHGARRSKTPHNPTSHVPPENIRVGVHFLHRDTRVVPLEVRVHQLCRHLGRVVLHAVPLVPWVAHPAHEQDHLRRVLVPVVPQLEFRNARGAPQATKSTKRIKSGYPLRVLQTHTFPSSSSSPRPITKRSGSSVAECSRPENRGWHS